MSRLPPLSTPRKPIFVSKIAEALYNTFKAEQKMQLPLARESIDSPDLFPPAPESDIQCLSEANGNEDDQITWLLEAADPADDGAFDILDEDPDFLEDLDAQAASDPYLDWKTICYHLNAEPVQMISSDVLRLAARDVDPAILRQALEHFSLKPESVDTIVIAQSVSMASNTGVFIKTLVVAARCWESIEPGIKVDWTVSPQALSLLLKAAGADRSEMDEYWSKVYGSQTHFFFDADAFLSISKSLKLEDITLYRFACAWINRLCMGIFPDIMKSGLDLNQGIRSLFHRSLHSQSPQLSLIKSHAPSKFWDIDPRFLIIPLLKSPYAHMLAKEVVLASALDQEQDQQSCFRGCIDQIWVKHLLQGASDQIVYRAVFNPDDTLSEEFHEYSAGFSALLGQKHAVSARNPFKMMNLPFTASKGDDRTSQPTQTYLQHCSQVHMDRLAELDRRFPNFIELTAHVRKKLLFALKFKKGFHTGPVLIKGPSGIGKTFYLKALKEALDLPALDLHASQITCGSALAGLQSTWGNGQPGRLAKHLEKTTIANSLVIFNELSQLKNNFGNGLHPMAVLLQALDADEAVSFQDAFTAEPMDISKLNWFFTANHVNNLEPFMLTRLTMFDIEPIKHYRDRFVIDGIVSEVLKRLDLKTAQVNPLDDLCCRLALDYLNDKGNMRELGIVLEDSIVDAVGEGVIADDAVLTLSAASLRRNLAAR